MSWTIAADIVIAENADGHYGVFAWPDLPPAEVTLLTPHGIHAAWRVSGNPAAYFNVKPPPAPLTLEQVRQYLADLRAVGLTVRRAEKEP